MTNVLIIGAGDIGQAVGHIISQKATVSFWDKDKSKSKGETNFAVAIIKAEIIFICAPSWANRDLASQIAKVTSNPPSPKTKNLSPKLVISLSKGVEEDSHKLVSEILAEELKGKVDYGVIAGPMIAEELMKGQKSTATVGLSQDKWQKKLQNLFENSLLNISFSSDLKGLSLCSVLKNIYTIGLGMADELEAETNIKSVMTDKALGEMLEIVPHLGGKKETVLGVAGLGDLLTTGWSGKSYNFSVGQEIVKNKKLDAKSEGTVALESIAKILGGQLKHYPLLDAIASIVLHHTDPKKILNVVA